MNYNEIEEKYLAMFPDFPDVVSVAQLRKMLGISRHLAYDLICEKKIKAFQIGNYYKIPKVNIIEYIVNSREDLGRTLKNIDISADLKQTEKT